MATLVVIGLILSAAAPFLRRRGKVSSYLLASGAAILILISSFGLLFPDTREGLAAVESNRRFYLFFLACEVPVLVLSLVSTGRFKSAFWVGWAINIVLAGLLIVMTIWLKFFWHW